MEQAKAVATKRKYQGVSRMAAANHFKVTAGAIQYWDRRGWLVHHEDRSIDLAATAAKVDANRDPTTGGKHDRVLGAPQPKYASPSPSSLPAPDQEVGEVESDDGEGSIPEDMTLADARAKKEYWNARKAKVDALRAEGELVPLEVAQKMYTASITGARTALEAVPVRVAPLLVGLKDQTKIRSLIRAEIESALRSLVVNPELE